MSSWVSTLKHLPPDGEEVHTAIIDNKGERNMQVLKRDGALWFIPDGSMYVYYTPTHWKPKENTK